MAARSPDETLAETQPRSMASRAMGAGAWSVLSYGVGQIIRLASNLILTRILSPEDFGLMALVSSFMIGLVMFSDMGIGPSILQSKRGEDPAFLDTAWTIKVIRGFILTATACLMAWPLAQFYDLPAFALVFAVTSSSLIVGGFVSTRIDAAARHLQIGRLTMVEIGNQLIGTAITIILALILRDVWALVWGNILGAFVNILTTRRFIPGHDERFRMEPEARREIVKFGKWIFLSTICGFFMFQGDRIILGRVLTLDHLGIYNIALFLASVPGQLASAMSGRLFIPLYREHPPARSREDRRVLERTRAGFTLFLLVVGIALALIGPWLVDVMYDPRYIRAGGLLVVIACINLIMIIPTSYDAAALAAGDSKAYFIVQLGRALIYTSLILAGSWLNGLAGLLAGQALAPLLSYPLMIWLSRRQGAWDPRHDLLALLIALSGAAVVLGMHGDLIGAALLH